MSRGFQGAVLRSFGGRDHEVTVTETVQLAPHFLRIRMSSPTVFEDIVVAPTAWLRFWFPDPDGGDTEHQRAYTLTEADPDAGTFAIDVVLHEPAGPASLWAAAAQPGWTIAAVSLGSSKFTVPESVPAGYLLIGDAASSPGINGILQAVPHDVPIELYFEVHDDDDLLIPLAEHPRLRVHRVPRHDRTSLANTLEARDWSNWYAWVATESGSLKFLRKRLRDEFGFPKTEMYCQAYWVEGRAMGKKRNDEEAPAPTTDTKRPEPEPTAPVTDTAPVRGQWHAQASKRLLAPVRSTLVLAGVLQAIVTLVQLAPFVLLVELARLLLAGAESDRLWNVGVAALVFMGGGAMMGSALALWLHIVDARFARRLRVRMLGKLARLPLGWFTSRGSGGIKQLIQDDTLSLHYLVTHAIPDAVAAVVAPVAVLAYLFTVDWTITLILFIPILIYVVTLWIMMMQSGPKIAESQVWAERMNGEAASYLDGQSVVRIFGGSATSSFRRRLDEYLTFLGDWQRPFIGKKTFMDLVTRPTTFLWLITATGTLFIVNGNMEPVDLLPFLLLGTTFGARLLGVGYGLSGIREGSAAARRIAVALDDRELEVREHTAPAQTTAGTVTFDRVTFGYRPEAPVLHDVSLTLTPGTVTALVGPSGSGKSTMAGLLARFHDVDAGAITIDGMDIRSMTGDELYSRVGFVLQQTQLIHGTVADNITLAVPDADRDRMVATARSAQIHDRILRLPHGYDTVLGEEVQLSGGERQRLTIARAILADTPILILDEATAFADPESEYLVQKALDQLTRGRTVLIIAHRLHTITGVDQIAVLDEGRIVQTGSHSDLSQQDGLYRRLWEPTAANRGADR